MTKRVALYARCSTADRQTTENQIRDLGAVVEQHGWTVAGVFDDAGISGGVPREERPAMQRLLWAIARRLGIGKGTVVRVRAGLAADG